MMIPEKMVTMTNKQENIIDTYFVIRRCKDGLYLWHYEYEGPGCPGTTVETWKTSYKRTRDYDNDVVVFKSEEDAREAVFKRRKLDYNTEYMVVEVTTTITIKDRPDSFNMVQDMLDRFDQQKRWVIRGKKGTKYEGCSYGFGMHEDNVMSESVYLWKDRDYAEKMLEECKAARNGHEDDFEIHEVTKDELYGIYRRSPTI